MKVETAKQELLLIINKTVILILTPQKKINCNYLYFLYNNYFFFQKRGESTRVTKFYSLSVDYTFLYIAGKVQRAHLTQDMAITSHR